MGRMWGGGGGGGGGGEVTGMSKIDYPLNQTLSGVFPPATYTCIN